MKSSAQEIAALHHISIIASSARQITIYAFTLALVAQTFHMVEHVAQVYQHAILGLSIADSHGILFFLDLEWNHFIFNTLFFGYLAVVFFNCNFHKVNGPAGENRLAFVAFNAGFIVQSYHVVEHIFRLVQFYQTGCTPCKGILGQVVDGVYLHALLNTTVYLLPLAAFILYGFHSRILYSRRDETVKILLLVIVLAMSTMLIGGVAATQNVQTRQGQHLPAIIPPLIKDQPATDFEHIHALVVGPENSSVLYVATHTGLVAGFNISDFKYEWFYINNERMDITALVLDPTQPYIMYTFGHPSANEETGIRRSYDRAQSWELVSTRPDPHQWIVSNSNPNIMYATDFPTNVLVRSDNRGVNWKIITSPATVLSIAVHPKNPDEILVGTERGPFRSKDVGLTWEPLNDLLAGIRVSAVSYDPVNPQVIYLSSFVGMMKSSDGGRSWISISNGISLEDTVEYISVDPRNPGVIYAASTDKIYKSIDGGLNWTLIRGSDHA